MSAQETQPEAQQAIGSELSAGEQQQLAEWNQTQGEYPRQSIAELFEEQVERTPGGVAVVFEGEELSYGELNGRANQLAHYLRGLGVGREVLVGICVERSLEMVVGLLGVLKAGGAYVPLDPSYPPERLRYMVEDAQVQVILTQQDWQRKLPATSVPVVCLDRDWGVIGQERKEDANSAVTAENLAYVAYTSGSTGAPKGVSILQKSVVRLVKGTDYVELSAGETFLQLAPISFDASTFEIWGCLLNGGRLVVMAPATPSLEEIGRALQQYQVTTLWLTAGLFHLMVNERVQDLRGVRQLLAGGDVLGLRQVQKVLQELPETRLINGYGPTEGTTFTCCYAMQGSGPGGSSVPIGRPIANTQVHILDATLQPVGIGVAGELYIGGDGLARGYWRRPELTAENFVPNPFSAEPGTRLYRSGDRARWLGDGNLEFYGRVDYQAKIRGYRVELEEIESVLQEQAGVQQAVVVVRAEGGGEKRLVGYVVAEPAAASASQLRTYLRSKLPEYMVPSAWVFLQQFPLTPNGKVDRHALPAPEGRRPRLAEPYMAPRTAIERLLSGIWQEVLQVAPVGIHDNFFDLGGESLLATQVVSRVRRSLCTDVNVRTLFETPTIAQLAEKVESIAVAKKSCPDEEPLTPVSRGDCIPLSYAQQRMWFLDQLQPGTSVYNVPTAVRLEGPLDIAILRRSLQEIVRRHEVLRTSFVLRQGEVVQEIAVTMELPLPLVDLSNLEEADRERRVRELTVEEARRPFNLSQEPLLRTILLRLSVHRHLLVLNLHHIIADGWSLEILERELGALYEAYREGLESPLRELPIQYADYAVWQRRRLQGDVLQEELSYWKQQLAGLPGVLELPTDRSRPAVQDLRGAKRTIVLSQELTEGLRKLSRTEGTTLFMTLLAAFEVLLARYSGQVGLRCWGAHCEP